MVSPFSAETIVALTQSGAQGATGDEIRAALHLPDTKEETENAIRAVLPTVHSDYIALTTANKIFVENNYAIKDDFQKVAKEVYQADFQNIEFGDSEEAAAEINKWVEDNTGDKIHELVKPDDLDGSTKIVLVNALYFQGNWTIPFDPVFTNKTKFFTSLDSTVDALSMYKESEQLNYYASDELDAQILEIPFQGEEATMTFVLPNQKDGIALLERQIEKALITPKYTQEFVQVVLPKFKIESTINFKDVLQKVGSCQVCQNTCLCRSWGFKKRLILWKLTSVESLESKGSFLLVKLNRRLILMWMKLELRRRRLPRLVSSELWKLVM